MNTVLFRILDQDEFRDVVNVSKENDPPIFIYKVVKIAYQDAIVIDIPLF